jgi:hypothetical protein
LKAVVVAGRFVEKIVLLKKMRNKKNRENSPGFIDRSFWLANAKDSSVGAI